MPRALLIFYFVGQQILLQPHKQAAAESPGAVMQTLRQSEGVEVSGSLQEFLTWLLTPYQ